MNAITPLDFITGTLAQTVDARSADGDLDLAATVAAARDHRVGPLLADVCRRVPGLDRLTDALGEQAAREAAADLIREVELRQAIDALDRAGIKPLIFKGAQLAYTHYPRPDLRPRVDSDLLVPSSARRAASRVLRAAGYESIAQVGGDLLMYQTSFAKRRDEALVHVIDLHWRIANPQRFGGILAYEELRAAAVPIRPLGPAARGLSDVHALLVACVHRVAHHFDSPNLLWQYDIHLIASRLSTTGWLGLLELANSRGVGVVCRHSLTRAERAFGTPVPADILASLGTRSSHEAATSAYLRPGRRHIQAVAGDLRALSSWADRWQLLRQHLLPPATYMRDVYAPASVAPLPVLYFRRVWRGARKWLARP